MALAAIAATWGTGCEEKEQPPAPSAAPAPAPAPAPVPEPRVAEPNWVQVAGNGRYLQFEDGDAFVPLGVALPGHSISLDYFGTVEIDGKPVTFSDDNIESLLRDMQTNEENFLRIDIEGTSLMPRKTIEKLVADKKLRFLQNSKGDLDGEYAKRIDRLLKLAERYGVYLGLALTTHSCDVTVLAQNLDLTPYHKKNGGPLQSMDDLFTDKQAIAAFKKRIELISGRFGQSRRIAMWELYNELLNCGGNDPVKASAWVTEMGTHLRDFELRRYGKAHPIVVSGVDIVPEHDFLADNPGTDLMVSHYYRKQGGSGNPVLVALDLNDAVTTNLKKLGFKRPFLENERTLSWRFPSSTQKEMEHAVAWTYIASGAAGGGATWLNIGAWQPFRDKALVAETHRAMRPILESIDFGRFDLRPLEVKSSKRSVVAFVVGDANQALGWLLHNNPRDYAVDNVRSWLAGEIKDPKIAPRMMKDLLRVLASQGVKAPIEEYKKELVRIMVKRANRPEPKARKLVKQLFEDHELPRGGLRQVAPEKRREVAKMLKAAVEAFRKDLARSPEVRVALAQAYRKHPKVSTVLELSGMPDAYYDVTWYDDTTGAVLSRSAAVGPGRVASPTFRKHVAFTMKRGK